MKTVQKCGTSLRSPTGKCCKVSRFSLLPRHVVLCFDSCVCCGCPYVCLCAFFSAVHSCLPHCFFCHSLPPSLSFSPLSFSPSPSPLPSSPALPRLSPLPSPSPSPSPSPPSLCYSKACSVVSCVSTSPPSLPAFSTLRQQHSC